MSKLSVLVFSLLATVSSAQARNLQDFVTTITQQHIIPNYQLFADATSAQHQVFNTFCEQLDNVSVAQQNLAKSQTAFHDSMDAWMKIQHITFGPVQLSFRRDRINYWPERRNAVNKALKSLLSDSSLLKKDKFTNTSVAGQGLPAIERLLFTSNALEKFQQDPLRCRLLVTLGHQ